MNFVVYILSEIAFLILVALGLIIWGLVDAVTGPDAAGPATVIVIVVVAVVIALVLLFHWRRKSGAESPPPEMRPRLASGTSKHRVNVIRRLGCPIEESLPRSAACDADGLRPPIAGSPVQAEPGMPEGSRAACRTA